MSGEQQTQIVQVFNAICAIFEETQKEEVLREYVAKSSTRQDEYYKAKILKRTANNIKSSSGANDFAATLQQAASRRWNTRCPSSRSARRLV